MHIPKCPQICPECHTTLTVGDKTCKGCGRNLVPIDFRELGGKGKYAYPDYPEFRNER